MRYFLLAITVLSLVVVTKGFTEANNKHKVYQACATQSIQRCNAMMHKYHYEYLCNTGGCWVEKNTEL